VSRFALVLVFAVVAFALARAEAPQLQPYLQPIPSSPVAAEMVPVPFRGDAPGFWIARHEVTTAEYEAFVQSRKRRDARRSQSVLSSFPDVTEGFGSRADEVVQVTRAEAAAYAAWLSRESGHSYRLPTEAEWEQACRAGEDDQKPLEERAWFVANAGAGPHPQGTRAADRLGLVDMLGNLGEWTADAAGDRSPAGVLKGGSWAEVAQAVGCGVRRQGAETAGFRLVRPYSDRD
jgi:formylglycine-generating enzyme required for sulfatase activity